MLRFLGMEYGNAYTYRCIYSYFFRKKGENIKQRLKFIITSQRGALRALLLHNDMNSQYTRFREQRKTKED